MLSDVDLQERYKTDDDSPFITPRSPSLGPSRPEVKTFRGYGSMHTGTQTLIQALQAVPWAEDQDNDDDIMNHDVTPVEAESDEDDKLVNRLTSSIHAITDLWRVSGAATFQHLTVVLRVPTCPACLTMRRVLELTRTLMSDEDMEDDFEPEPMAPGQIAGSSHSGHIDSRRRSANRSGSMATVKQQRRAQLADKLREVFELDGIKRSHRRDAVLASEICFAARIYRGPGAEIRNNGQESATYETLDPTLFILKNDVLSWYQSSSDPYFPHGVVDLRYVITRLCSQPRRVVKAIRKVMLKTQNMGDSIKIRIPYSAVMDVEKSSAMDFSETIEVKVRDRSSDLSLDSYFFAYFHDLAAALEQIREAVRTYRSTPATSKTVPMVDTTISRPPASIIRPADRAQSAPVQEQTPKSPSGFRLTSLLRPLQENLGRPVSAPSQMDGGNEDFTHILKRGGSSFIPVTASPKVGTSPEGEVSTHTYPPSRSRSRSPSSDLRTVTRDSATGSWSVGVPSWLRAPSRTLFGSSVPSGVRPVLEHAATMPASASVPAVSEVLSSNVVAGSGSHSGSGGSNDFGFFSILEAPETMVDADTSEKFRASFAFDDKETLLGIFPGYIFRLLPVYGRLYVSNNYFCFRSSGPLGSRTRMILPLRDILSTEKSKSFRFSHVGLVVIVRGHEELFFEFSDEERRSGFVSLLQRQMDDVRRRTGSCDAQSSTNGRHDSLILEEFGPQTPLSLSGDLRGDADMADSLPAVMFTSKSSTFLTFKPEKSLHFTFLTIGSRGDVQPYIALAKGLLADGHRVRIATHGEFKEWIEAHGIEFGYVGGDPAELMRICVENGTFTVSFLKEGMQKFRGWLDDLLKTSWEACQDTDVLVESPSAMSGFHIAEALKIPYFRAFTMTWSRTRAYPHAFAVPEHKMGGNYNYMSYVLFDQVFWRAISGQINRWRRNTLGLQGTSLDKMEPHKIPFLYNFSPIVVPAPLDWPEWIRVTGYWFLDDANVGSTKWAPPQDLLNFIESAHKAKKKIVYIGFGSIVVPDPKAMTRCVIDAIVQSGVYAIMSKGWSDRLVKNAQSVSEPEEPLPKQIYPISSIPHDWLFKRIDAACHHGGAGSTGASLRAGIPTVIKPFFGISSSGLTVDHLSHALVTATTDQKQIDRARAVGEEIRAENGVATAIEAIYRDLEYARSLIKGLGSDHGSDHFDAEHATIRDFSVTPERPSPTGSSPGPASDWSVISDQEEAHI
ncbi:Sterol 3-beta-glucosyltransferase [Grifola frondosa]|uniref:sterol 3beta-glucosyltransferase n=1 Tax=Grifola frondosa TaxID=5627 RepID=A0A1C7MRP1_GRIFR|nr:Sterol 3-beta-glucosyltransferase [Grifola frondosa]